MRKKEHIHIHALLAEVAQYLIEDGTIADERLSAYGALETRPSSIYQPKEKHHEAVMALSSAIQPCLEETLTDGYEQPTNR